MWGESITADAYTVSGDSLVTGDSLDVTLTPSTSALTDNGTITVSGTKITNSAGDEVTDNYTITYAAGKLTITHNTTLAPSKIEVTKTTTAYIAGQTLNVDDLTVTATYADGYSEEVTGYTTNAGSIDMKTVGDKTLTVSYTANGGTVTKDIAITVSNGFAVNLPTEQVGYELTADTTEALWNGDVTLTFVMVLGYTRTDDFAIKVNGEAITLNDDWTYTISNVQEALTITVEGVADITAPSVEIKVKGNGWTQFLNTITFGIFFKETQDVTITATDVNGGSGLAKVYYYISDEALSKTQVKEITSWIEYTEKISITPDNKYVIYAKAVDNAGNITYVSSDGMVLDATAPVISGATDGTTYEGDVTFNVTDTYLDKVYVDGAEVELTDGSYTISADNAEHTIKATDTAGNETSVTITVNYGTLSVTDADYSGTYDGQIHSITVNVTNVNGATVTYSTDGAEYSDNNPTFTNAGTYTVYYKVTKDRYTTVTGEATVTIAAKELSVTADNQTITVGGSIDTGKYTVSGLVDRDTVSAVILTPSTTEVTNNGTIAVSDVKIVNAAGDDVTANYDITYVAGTLVIEKAEDTDPEPTPDPDSVEYGITDGANSEWTLNSDGSITITGNGDYEKFVGVKVDGALIDEVNYTAKSGSTIITLKSSYLNTLSIGTHTFEIVWSDGTASTNFTVEATVDDDPRIPDTGDNTPIGLWLVLLIGTGLTAVGFWKKRKYIVEK